jgi:hypothetical protein
MNFVAQPGQLRVVAEHGATAGRNAVPAATDTVQL